MVFIKFLISLIILEICVKHTSVRSLGRSLLYLTEIRLLSVVRTVRLY